MLNFNSVIIASSDHSPTNSELKRVEAILMSCLPKLAVLGARSFSYATFSGTH